MKYTMNLGAHVLIWFNAVFGANSRAKGKYIFAKRLYKCICIPVCLTTENVAIEKIAVSFILFVII